MSYTLDEINGLLHRINLEISRIQVFMDKYDPIQKNCNHNEVDFSIISVCFNKIASIAEEMLSDIKARIKSIKTCNATFRHFLNFVETPYKHLQDELSFYRYLEQLIDTVHDEQTNANNTSTLTKQETWEILKSLKAKAIELKEEIAAECEEDPEFCTILVCEQDKLDEESNQPSKMATVQAA